jgi:hypothetical protein
MAFKERAILNLQQKVERQASYLAWKLTGCCEMTVSGHERKSNCAPPSSAYPLYSGRAEDIRTPALAVALVKPACAPRRPTRGENRALSLQLQTIRA